MIAVIGKNKISPRRHGDTENSYEVAHHRSDRPVTGQKVVRDLSTNFASDSSNCKHWIGFSLTVQRQLRS